MLESINSNNLEYVKLSQEEMNNRGILGRLVGDCADFAAPTRNGRKYTEELWEAVFNNPIMKEKLKNKVCYGELGHPENRSEIDMEKVAVCLAEQPKKGKNGKLQAVFDILSTPNGKILKALCDYGSILGVSSRGNGDVITNMDGSETVDPNTYECECFDIVLIPAVESARLTYVTESLDKKKTSLKEALNEALNNSSEHDQKIMKNTIEELNINLNESIENKNMNQSESNSGDNITGGIYDDLQSSLKLNKQYEETIKQLREQLTVCYTKERELKVKLSESTTKVKALENARVTQRRIISPELKKLEEQIATQTKENTSQQEKIASLSEELAKRNEEIKKLRANITLKESQLKEISSTSHSLKESMDEQSKKETLITEKYEDLRKDYGIKKAEYKEKVVEAKKLVEKYQKIARTAIDKYISVKAVQIGVTPEEVKTRLKENYTFADIDSVCESLNSYKLSINSLPFEITNGLEKGRAKVIEKKESIIPDNGLDDSVDGWLMNFYKK